MIGAASEIFYLTGCHVSYCTFIDLAVRLQSTEFLQSARISGLPGLNHRRFTWRTIFLISCSSRQFYKSFRIRHLQPAKILLSF